MIQMVTDALPAVGLALVLGLAAGFGLWHLMWWRSGGRHVGDEIDRLKATAARESTRAEDLSSKVDYLVATNQELESKLELYEIERRRLLAAQPSTAAAVAELEDTEGRAHRIEIHVADSAASDSEVTIDLRDGSNLQRVEGIGPQIAHVLRDAGIDGLDDLAIANPDYLAHILEEAGPRFRMHDPSSWPEQARSLNGAHH